MYQQGGRIKRQLTSAVAVADYDVDVDADKPIFRPAPTNITVSPGDRASLKCRVDNLGTKTVGTPFTLMLRSRLRREFGNIPFPFHSP